MPKVQLPAQGFRPRWYQLPVWKEITTGRKKRAVLCWPRRHGKDILSLNLMAYMALRTGPGEPGRIGNYVYVLPYQTQARKIVWNGIDSLGRRFIHAFPPELVENRSDNEMFLRFKNGSTFQVFGGDDPDRLVGTNPVGIIFSEYALTNPRCWQLLSPILAENEGWALFNSTPRGNNHFKRLLDDAKADTKHWYWSQETSKTLKVLSPEQLRRLRDELKDEALFLQEAFCSFEAPMQGAYYATQFKILTRQDRLRELPIDPLLSVDTGWDLGMNDSTAIWFIQPYRGEYRLVDYYENTGEGLIHYVRYLRDWAERNNVQFAEHFFPHDVQVRELLADGKTRLQKLREMGLKGRVVPKHELLDGIQEVRDLLPLCYIDPKRCSRGVDALKAYAKEWDDNLQVFKDRPLHNWASHGADALRTYAMGKKVRRKTKRQELPVNYESTETVFSV